MASKFRQILGGVSSMQICLKLKASAAGESTTNQHQWWQRQLATWNNIQLQSTKYWCSVNKQFFLISDGTNKNCLVNETHNIETTQNLSLVSDRLTNSGEWVASLPQPSSGRLGTCRWTGWTDWNGTGASKLCSSPLALPSHPPPTFHQTFSRGRNLGIDSFQLLAYSWLDRPIWLHLKSVSIPGYNKRENLH